MPSVEPRAAVHVAGTADDMLLEAVHHAMEELWSAVPDVPTRDRIRFDTALAEVVANVVRHAVPAGDQAVHVKVALTVDDDSARAEVVDDGIAVPVDLDRELPDETAVSGRGLVLIQRATDQFGFERRSGHNVWRIICRYRA